MMIFLFWFSVTVIIYVYIGYPLVVLLAGILRNRFIKKDGLEPHVTILIAAYNESRCIAKTIENKLSLEYPPHKLDIVVISDCSDDGTDEIVARFNDRVKLIRQEPRAGKTAALNMAVPEAKGEILIFSDANSIYAKGAVSQLVNNFSDPSVGYVTGKMVYSNPDGTIIGDGCSAYMKYENFIRRYETRIGSVVGVDGGIDAVRKSLYRPMKADQLPDFVLPLSVIDQEFRVVYEPDAILKEESLKTAKDEYRMRVRVSLRALWAIFDMRHLLNDSRNLIYAWQMWSHKVLRYLCFLFLIGALISNLLIVHRGLFYACLFILQCAVYATPFISRFSENRIWDNPILRLVKYFFLINLASAHAFIKFIMGKKQLMWTPRKG